jgi:hypothetical protein
LVSKITLFTGKRFLALHLNLLNMNTIMQEQILKIIENAHRFSQDLNGGSIPTIHKDLIRTKLPSERIEDINTSLFELRELGKVNFDFNKDCNLIYVT